MLAYWKVGHVFAVYCVNHRMVLVLNLVTGKQLWLTKGGT